MAYGRSRGNHLSTYFELSREALSACDDDNYEFEADVINLKNRKADICESSIIDVNMMRMSFPV